MATMTDLRLNIAMIILGKPRARPAASPRLKAFTNKVDRASKGPSPKMVALYKAHSTRIRER